jgi:hypothetical protein
VYGDRVQTFLQTTDIVTVWRFEVMSDEFNVNWIYNTVDVNIYPKVDQQQQQQSHNNNSNDYDLWYA